MKRVDLSTIDPQLRACIEEELASLPGAHLIKRKGRLFLKGKNGFEILVERLCAVKARWVQMVEHAPLAEEDKWKDLLPPHRRRRPAGRGARGRVEGDVASQPPALSPRMKTARKQDIVMAYVLATKGRLPDNLDKLLQAMREIIGDVSESEVRKAIAWALRQTKRPHARIIRTVRVIRVSAHRPEFPV
jgi:hypothetical protein